MPELNRSLNQPRKMSTSTPPVALRLVYIHQENEYETQLNSFNKEASAVAQNATIVF